MGYSIDSIYIDSASETEKITGWLRKEIVHTFKKRGAVVGVSGGVDSSVVISLCARALGPEHVIGVMMPEKESSPQSAELAVKLMNKLGVKYVSEDMSDSLTGIGCYRRRDEAIKRLFPEYTKGYKAKILLPENDTENPLNIFSLVIIAPDGSEKSVRLPLKEYLQVVAASNFKQRSRMSMLYYHAESRNYAVAGTANKNEHEQGFFVKYGDGGADIKPIVHLYKTQVYQLAAHLGVSEEICLRIPTTDTYSAEQTQEEFFFREPFEILDRIWFGWENGVPAVEIASVLKIPLKRVESIIGDIQRKIKTTEYLRSLPLSMKSEVREEYICY